MKVGKILNFLQGEALNFVFQNLGAAPSTPVPGQAWFNTASGRLEIRGASAPYDPTDRTTHSGFQPSTTISDFSAAAQTAAKLVKLQQFAKPDDVVDMNLQRVTGVGAPISQSDAVRLADLEAIQNGTLWKPAVRVRATGNVSVSAAPASIDGVTLNQWDRILLPAQTAGAENGIWRFNGAGAPLLRAPDTITSGIVVPVLEGTQHADTAWRLNSPDSGIVVGTTATVWGQFANPFSYVQGTGITISGGNTINANVVSVHGRTGAVVGALNDYDDTQIKNTHASAHGFWTGTGVLSAVLTAISNQLNQRALASRAINTAGGSYLTGGGQLTADRSLAVDAVTAGGTAAQAAKIPATGAGGKLDVSFMSAVLNGTDVVNSVATGTLGTTIASALTYLNNNLGLGAPKKYSETLATSAASYLVTHNLGSKDLVGQVREVATDEVVLADIVMTSTTTATVSFTTAPTAGTYRVVFLG